MSAQERPETLYLQSDNAGDGKSRWNLALASWMVYVGMFKKVVLGFLLVGHTHEDIDQMFSKFSMALAGTRRKSHGICA
jgi:hypothetical protein